MEPASNLLVSCWLCCSGRARKLEYMHEIGEALKETKKINAQIAFSKQLLENANKLEEMTKESNLDHLKDVLAEQNRQHCNAGVVAIRDAKSSSKDELDSSLLAMAAKSESLKPLALADACKAELEFAKLTQDAEKELVKISSLKKEVEERVKALEFLKSVQDLTSDSQYDAALDLQSLNLS
ncbi:uncharacterized protein LOC119464919 isoform X2 [Dermacentor silvarum]|uniref:uncharacterized protein LOC119464919 isoform X2 n=1 Tax=Dermacentor silvarum TaxID=543639 RepID=UPI002101994A|nr:uncharacterized protein LOC119464919 isoform X2 [Dermacentor silvarum]